MDYPPALFSYSITPNTVPYTDDPSSPSTVGLMIAVNNGTGQNVDCSRLVFTLPVGTGAGALTNDPSAVSAAPSLGTPWSIQSNNAGSFTALPQAPVTGLNAGDSIAFSLSGIPINQLPGLAEITIYEGANPIRQTQVGVSKVPPGLAITSFSANPIQVEPGQESRLAWTTTGATSATLSWAGQSEKESVNGQYSVTPQETTTYTLTASDNSGSTSQQITVTVPRVQILSFGASPTNVAQNGASTLAWLVVNADTCHIEPVDISVDPNQGNHIVIVEQNTVYTLVATGPGGTVSMGAPVNVMPVVISSFTATPNPITLSQSATLQWATEWASSCSINQGVGPVPTQGSTIVTPWQTKTTTYTLTAQGLNPQTQSASVTVVMPIINSFGITADPAQPDQVTLAWDVASATAQLWLDLGDGPQLIPLKGAQVLTIGVDSVIVSLNDIIRLNLNVFPRQDGSQFSSLQLTSANGICTPGSTVTVAWQCPQGYVELIVTNTAANSVTSTSSSGSLDFDVGEVDTPLYMSQLWEGCLFLGSGSPDSDPLSVVWLVNALPDQ